MNENNGRRIVIPDTHGCIRTLKALIKKLDLTSNDAIYFLGDYIDNGVDSKGVVDYIIELKANYNVVCLKGNHEQVYEDSKLDAYNMKDTNGTLLPKYQEFWNDLLYYVELDDTILVHASINFNAVNPFSDYETMLWRASRSMYTKNNTGKRIVRGHSKKPIQVIEEALRNRDMVIPLDNGCHRNTEGFRYLCALELNELTLIRQEYID